MSDHFVDAAYQKKHYHDPMGGTPHIPDEDKYRHEEHKGRHVLLSDTQFDDTYPTNVAAEAIVTRPKC
jgi:hypothetical protein